MPDVATIEDVATRAGVSVATVSRALRGLPHVSPATRERVQRIATELDYRPNPHASRLAAGRSGTIGIALPLLNSWFYGNVLAGVEAVVSEDRHDMHLVTVGDADAMARFVGDLPSLSKQVDGLVMVDLFMLDDMWDAMAEGGMPIATVGLEIGRFDSVVIDNVGAAHRAVTHLAELGHRRIAFIGGGPGYSEFESAEVRRQGYRNALADAGIEDDPDLHVPGGFTVDGGREVMLHLLEGEHPSAVFCASDEMAMGAMWAAADAGLSVPEDVSVVGFDDQPAAAALGLTTVHQPVSSLAARAAAMVLDRVGGSETPPRRVEVETHLEVRRSTARTI